MRRTRIVGAVVVALAAGAVWTAPLGGQQVSADEEVRRVAADPAVVRAFRHIEGSGPRGIDDLVLLTEIPAPPFREAARARAFADLLRESGADTVWMDEEGNVLALRRGLTGDRVVALDGHLDTVFPVGTDVTVRTRGDTLFAPGIGDDTQGLVLVLQVLRALEHAGVETEADLLFIGSVGEEGLGDLRGVKHLFREGGSRIDSWIAVDGGGAERVAHQGVGSHRYRVTFRGPGGHSWGAFGLANPHHALGRAIALFQETADAFTRTGPRTSYNVGRIGGGTSVNSIPFESWMEVDMRSVSPESLERIDALLHEAVGSALAGENAVRRRGPAIEATLDPIGRRPSGYLDPESAIVRRAVAATRHLGVEPELGTGSTNSNIPIAMGLPAITIGKGGRSGGAHSLDEWFVPEAVDLAVKKALLIVLVEAGLAPTAEGR